MQIPNIMWPLTQLGTDVAHAGACTLFAIAHWVAAVTGNGIDSSTVIDAYNAEREFRDNSAQGINIFEGFLAATREGWLPAGTTIRRAHDLSRVVFGPIVASYDIRQKIKQANPDGTFQNTGYSLGRHAVTIIGWDGQHIVFANNWGSDWGDKGFGRMTLEQHNAAVHEMWQIVVPGQPSTPGEAAQAAAEQIPQELADQVIAVQRNLIALGYSGLPTTATMIMPDIIRRSMAGDLSAEQERAKSNLAHVYTMLLLQGVDDAQINAVHAAITGGE